MKDKIYYYDRNGVLKLTLNEYPYFTEWADLRDWQWGYNEQFGRYTSFRRDKHERELIIAIADDYLKAHDDLCDIFAADVIAGQPGQLRANDWTLNCYITEAEYEYGHGLSRKAVFKVMSEDPAWIRKNTRVLSGESAGETETDYGRDYTEGLIEAGSDTAPYLFRQSPQFSNGYNRETDLLVGGSVAWNQLAKELNSTNYTSANATSVSYDNNSVTFTATANYGGLRGSAKMDTVKDHKYLMSFDYKVTTAFTGTAKIIIATDNIEIQAQTPTTISNTSYASVATVCNCTASANVYLRIWDTRSSGFDPISVRNIQIIDLTQMFGSTIADYIYSLEQATAGAGVAWFKKLFNKPYYAYNAGELKSVKGLVSHDMVGFNAWDEEWEVGALSTTGGNATSSTEIRSKNYIPVVGGQTYYLYCAVASTFNYKFYDADKNFISGAYIGRNNTLLIPNDARYMRFYMGAAYGTTYKNDICINLSWDGERDGEYEEYVEHIYELDSDLELRGIPKLTAGNDLYYDGDVYEPDGTVTRKYGVVDLGTLNWSYYSDYQMFYAAIVEKKAGTGNLLCSKYRTTDAIFTVSNDKSVGGNGSNGTCYVRDSSFNQDAAAFKTAMSGVYLVYELATPTTETAEPYTNPQVVDESGTEEYVSTSIVPVGHQTTYGLQAALRGYNYGYSLTDVHTTEIVLPSSQNGYEVLFYGPITNPAIYLNGHPVQVYVTLTAGQRLRVVSNGSEKTIKILSSTGVETDAFIYRNKEFSPFINIGQHTEVSFGDFRFEFTTIERRSEPTWT